MPLQVLVVEDEPDIAALLRMCLDPTRYEVVVAGDLAAARAIASSPRRLDLVILDLLLPDGCGLEMCRELKAGRPSVPILVLTGWVHAASREGALAAGADLFVPKPFDPDELQAAVARLLHASSGGSDRDR